MKYINLLILLMFVTAFGFQTNNFYDSKNIQQATFVPTPKVIPQSVPIFDDPIDKSKHKGQIQINPAPFPFNLTHPYVVWIDGEKADLSLKEVKALAKTLNLTLEKPKDTAEIHSGDGWLRPKIIK